MVDVTVALQGLAAVPVAVGAVGGACMGIRVSIAAFRAARAAGLSTSDSFTRGNLARRDYENPRDVGGMGFEKNPRFK